MKKHKSSSGDSSNRHPYINEALKSGVTVDNWLTSKIKRVGNKVEVVEIYLKQVWPNSPDTD